MVKDLTNRITEKKINNFRDKSLRNKVLSGIASLVLFGCSAGLIHNGGNDSNKSVDYTMARDGNYPGVVVFSYENQPDTYEDKNLSFDLLTKGCLNSLSMQEWYSREAVKYGKQIQIPLTLFPEDVQIPKKFIDTTKNYQLDLEKFSEYLRDTYPELKNFDFIAIYYKADSPDIGNNGYAIKSLAAFCIKSMKKFSGLEPPHEFAHLIGATDKYKTENDCDPRDLMKTNHPNLDDEVIISEPTAKEIGWK